MNRLPRGVVQILLLSVLLTPGSLAASATVPEKPLDEVVVEGTRGQLKKMLQEMVKLENRFYERYNELNTNDDFDLHCALEARIGTNIRRRYCRPVYEERAMESEGNAYAEFLKDITPDLPGEPPGSRGPPPPKIEAIAARREEYRDNVREVVTRNPELVETLAERYEMGKRYEDMRRKVWGLNPPPEEVEVEEVEAAPE